jgi:hypothetical protein
VLYFFTLILNQQTVETSLSIKKAIKTKTTRMSKKGSAKNTKNKALHSKLMAQKKNKKKSVELQRKERLKAIVRKAQDKKS